MPRNKAFLIVMSILVCFTGVSAAQQLWSGVLSPSRATNWTNAGVVGGIPSGSWTQCGSTIGAYSGSATTINNAIASCGTNQYVLLGSGTFNLSSGIDFAHKSNVALRGSGANSTFLAFAPGYTAVNCGGYGTTICIENAGGEYWNGYPTAYSWTGGYAQGSNQVTLSGTAGITTNSILVLNQCNDGYIGSPCVGAARDTGSYFNCGDVYVSPSSGCSFNGSDSGNGTTGRFQSELVQVTAVNPSTGVVTIASPLKHPNWRSGQTPQAWFFTPVRNDGVESLTIDASNVSGHNIDVLNSVNVWVKGARIINPDTEAIYFLDSVHFEADQNYIYHPRNADPFGLRTTVTCDGLFQNNIIQQARVAVENEGNDCGTVVAYNFIIENLYDSDAMFQAFRPHSNGNDYQLYEGNIATDFYGENYHGTDLMETNFRNFYTGWESYPSHPKDWQTNAYASDAYNRYHNVVGNVLGTPGYHSIYQSAAQNPLAVYIIGAGNAANSGSTVPSDPLVMTSLLRWGNYDVVTGAARFCGNSSNSGWSSTCGGVSEVPSSISAYPNSVPTVGDTAAGQSALPPSFYLASKPSWWGSMPWPAIGPDVTGGDLGQCSGGTFNKVAALATAHCGGSALVGALNGHVNANPAMACYLNVMSGPPDGSGGALTFNASACYAGSSGGSSSNGQPPPPTNLVGTVQ